MHTKPTRCRAMISTNGYRVEQVLVQRSLHRPPRQYLRVTWRGTWLADCASVAEVARHVSLETLVAGDS